VRREPYPEPSSAAASAVMRANRKTGSKPEMRLRSELHRRGLRFRKNLLIRLGSLSVRPDIVFPAQRVAVFVDGCFWHRCPEHGVHPRANADYWQRKLDRNVVRDERVDTELLRAAWLPIRAWEHEAADEAADSIKQVVEERRSIRVDES
jgi:DNA mismatch endonuclease (patch repair protein)